MRSYGRLSRGFLLFAASAVLAGSAWAQAQQQQGKAGGQLTAAERMFLMKAARGNQMEVDMAQLARQRSQNERVRQYAQQLEQSHRQANQQLTQLAKNKGVTLPALEARQKQPPSGQAERQVPSGTTGEAQRETAAGQADRRAEAHNRAVMNRLQKLSGAEFDREFLRTQIEHHQTAISVYERTATTQSVDTQVRQYAQNQLPVLRQHLRTAQGIYQQEFGQLPASQQRQTGQGQKR